MKTLIVLWIKWTGMVKTKHRFYWWCSSYALSKLIVDNGLDDLWRRENPDSPEFTLCDRSFCIDPGSTQENITISRKNLFFLLKTQKNNLFSKCPVGNSKSSFKENTRAFSKTSTIQEIRISKPKKRLWNLYKKKIWNQKSNQWLKIYKINFIDKKTNKEMMLNFVLILDRSRMAKKAPKLSSEYLNFLAKLLTKKISNEHINLCEVEIALDEIIKFR